MKKKEAIQELEKIKREKQDAYNKFEGFVIGLRAARPLNPTDEGFLQLVEAMVKGFKNVWDDIITTFEIQLDWIERIERLETKVSEIENNVQQIRVALDEEFHLFRTE
jgi:hypothetical protein